MRRQRCCISSCKQSRRVRRAEFDTPPYLLKIAHFAPGDAWFLLRAFGVTLPETNKETP
ncbi:hypothetical protein BURKHO8Y_30275 [Burkholderia sp. 8Y]|nr:hypothetical protein BURKHO8Y_30275 [Burkholderia sp. 8Y]